MSQGPLFLAVSALILVTLALPAPASAAPGCFEDLATIVGTSGDDIIVGTPGRDVIVAGAGDDRVRARGGRDVICGNRGADFISGALVAISSSAASRMLPAMF
jgi:RTX calcium-binding nonapeptide repeat (4 copies)